MKESINYYYNFNVDEVIEWDNVYTFKIKDINYYFVKFKRSEKELDELLIVSAELKNKGYKVHDIVVNRFGKIVTNVFNELYILLKPVDDVYLEYDLIDIIKMNKSLTLNNNKSKLYRNSWASLWSAKIDYFEYQISELGIDKNYILDSFNYYVGLAENAISYVNATMSKYNQGDIDKITLAHRRINFPNYELNYMNPLSFIFDLEVRDIAEFIKASFFAGENALNYLKMALKIQYYSIYSLQLLYARLLYPSYYFDLYEKIMNGELEEDSIIRIVEKSDEYEEFLKNAYNEISKYVLIERVEWILNKK